MDFLWTLFLLIAFVAISGNLTVFLVWFLLKKILKSERSDKTLKIIGFSLYMLMVFAYLDIVKGI